MDDDGYGARAGQMELDRLLEDARTLSPLGVERAARGYADHAGSGEHAAWMEAERAALHAVETGARTMAWDELRNRILGLTERSGAMISWRLEHGEKGHRATDALLGAALALLAGSGLDAEHARVLTAPMAEALPWLGERRPV